ncbi:substrate-binding domain-containing protein, partial [Christensenellaceae bacterium OttesenSCG-928-M15]|nr:substrate-binding domain-containing protein [Christensenellaceae bacterium OttesenSCG-928-M15]
IAHTQSHMSVSLDNYMAGTLAAEHFLSLGHKNIACIMGPLSVWISRERTRGFKECLYQNNIELRDRLLVEGDFRFESGYEVAKQIFSAAAPADRPTAVWAQSDLMAAGVLKYLYTIGLRVPQDVSIIGMDNIGIAKMLTPSLTTIAQPFRQIARESVQLLLHADAAERPAPSITLSPSLVERESTGPAARK